MLAAEADLCVCVRIYVCVCVCAHVRVCVCMCAWRTVANILVHVPCTTIHSCVLRVVGINEYIYMYVRQRFDTLIKGT